MSDLHLPARPYRLKQFVQCSSQSTQWHSSSVSSLSYGPNKADSWQRDRAWDAGAQKRPILCKKIILRSKVPYRTLFKLQCKQSWRLGCQGRKVKVHVTRTEHNQPCIVRDCKLWAVEVQYSFLKMWRLLLTWFVYIVEHHTHYK
jgi:hypothetical protein